MRLTKARKELVTAMMRDTIFEAAGSVLERHGVNGITMDRVATTAGLATGSLYNYFRDKDELLAFIYGRLVEPFLETIERIAEAELAATQKLEKILGTTLERSAAHKGIIRLLAEAGQDSQIRRRSRPCLLRILTSVFEQGIAEGCFRPHNASQSGHMVLGCLAELFELQASETPETEAREYVDALIAAICHGFTIHTERMPPSDEASSSSSHQ